MTPDDFTALPELLTFTVDLEDHLPVGNGAQRCRSLTLRLLEFLDELGAQATFFVVGELALRAPDLIREIGRRGHEIGCHGHWHEPLTRLGPAGLRRELALARPLLEDLAGTAVPGFRAPFFSLVRRTSWAPEILAEAGFRYSSSVLPARAFAFGYPGAPLQPFIWPAGLLELPCPIGRAGPLRLPCLGGMYLRYLPSWRLRQLLRNVSTETVWTYCHPYDFDAEDGFRRAQGRSLIASLFLWRNRAPTLDRLRLIMAGRRSSSFARRLAELLSLAKPWDPA